MAHVEMGINGRDAINANEVIYIPAKDSFLNSWKEMKKASIMPSSIRTKLARDAVKKYGFKVSTVEIEEIVSGKTYDTARYFKQLYTSSEIYLCFGLDNLFDLDKWYRSEDLIKENNFLIVDRYGRSIPKEILSQERFKNKLTCIENKKYGEVSSTKIREMYLNGQLDTIKELIPENVYQYLSETKEVYR